MNVSIIVPCYNESQNIDISQRSIISLAVEDGHLILMIR